MKQKFLPLIICFLLVAITIALYWPVRTYEFTAYDDPEYVRENIHVQRGLNAETVAWAFKAFHASNWHPLTWLSHAIDVQLFGLDAGKHHLVNALFHAANAMLVFLVFRKMTGALWRSAFVAALFAWHPLRVESVAWVAERKDVLSTSFGLLSILFYVRWAKSCAAEEKIAKKAHLLFSFSPHLVSYVLALVFFAMALLSKPMWVTLPCMLLLLDFWPLGRVASDVWRVAGKKSGPSVGISLYHAVLEKLPFFLLALISCVLTFLAQQQGGSVSTVEDVTILKRLMHAVLGYFGYIDKCFWPWPLAVLYPIPESVPVSRLIISSLALAGITFIAVKYRRSRPYLLWGWLWFVGTLVPVIGIVQVGSQLMADRYTYIPLLGLTAAIVWLLCDMRLARPVAYGVVAFVVLACCAVMTHFQISYWRNGILLFEHAIAVTPRNYIAENNLGSAFAKAGRLDEAEAAHRRAVALRPSWFMYNNLADTLAQRKKFAEALPLYEKATQLKPGKAELLKNWGLTLLLAGRTNDAIEKFTAAVQANPHFADGFVNLGYGLAQLGRNDEAIAALNEALALNSDSAEPHLHLGFILAQQGNEAEAVAHYQAAVRLNPFYAEAHNNLANILLRQGRIDDALHHSLAALQVKPDFEPAHINAADACLAKGDIAGTIQHWRQAVRSRPDWPELCNNLAWLLATCRDASLRNGAEAVELAERACKLSQPASADFLATLAAAYAEAGRFDDAIKAGEQSLAAAQLGQQNEIVARMTERLELFRSHRPFHE